MARPRALATVTKAGDQLASLCALRDRLARDIDRAAPNESAQLSRQLVLVLERIAALAPVQKESPLDDLAARRTARLAGSANP